MTVDPLEIVRQWLCQGDTALSRMVAGRVMYPWMADWATSATGWKNIEPAVVLVGLDGEPLAESVIQSVDVEIRCFGGGEAQRKEPRKAWACYAALRDRLCAEDGQFVFGQRLPGGLLLGCEETKSGTYETEPGVNWPFVSSNWTFETSAT